MVLGVGWAQLGCYHSGLSWGCSKMWRGLESSWKCPQSSVVNQYWRLAKISAWAVRQSAFTGLLHVARPPYNMAAHPKSGLLKKARENSTAFSDMALEVTLPPICQSLAHPDSRGETTDPTSPRQECQGLIVRRACGMKCCPVAILKNYISILDV